MRTLENAGPEERPGGRGAGETLLRKGVDGGKGVLEMGSLAGNWAIGGEQWELGTGDRANLNPGKREGKGCQAKGVNAGWRRATWMCWDWRLRGSVESGGRTLRGRAQELVLEGR